jgi:hypothetical protein
MAKIDVEFLVPVSFDGIGNYFNDAITHWVVHHQTKTSGIAKAMMTGAAIENVLQGNGFMAALSVNLAKGQGVQHLSTTVSKVQIPASGTTYGGEMVISAFMDRDKVTLIHIKGNTQGLLSGTLKENVSGIQEFLINSLPELERSMVQVKVASTGSQTSSLSSELEKLALLYKEGVLSEDEYQQAKNKILI